LSGFLRFAITMHERGDQVFHLIAGRDGIYQRAYLRVSRRLL